jgi:3'(2'), 5'-bisphosphate nucleotidase
MNATDEAALVAALLPAVLEAGRIELAYFESPVEVQRKADASPVTAADHEAEAVLLRALGAAAPGVPVVAEELAAAGKVPAIAEEFFLVDPLDGTREFINGFPEFTINIALVRGTTPVFGLVYAPASGQLFATLAAGRACEAAIGPADKTPFADIAWAPLAARTLAPGKLVALDSRSHPSPKTAAWLDRLGVAERRGVGSSLKFCLIARGAADVYPRFGTTSEWDTAAGHAILAAAGGRVVTAGGAELAYGKAAAGFKNPDFFAWGRGGPLAV